MKKALAAAVLLAGALTAPIAVASASPITGPVVGWLPTAAARWLLLPLLTGR